MRFLILASWLVACGAEAEPDEIEIRVSTGAVSRDQLSRIIVLVDPPVPFDRSLEGGRLADGVDFEFFAAGESNRLMVTFTPPTAAPSIDQDLLFTAELGGGDGQSGAVRVVGYDLAGRAIAHAENLDVRFGGFVELELELACGVDDCGPEPRLGGYPVTLDASSVTSSIASIPEGVSIFHSHALHPAPGAQVTVFADPEFQNGTGRIAIVDTVRAAMFTTFDLPPNMLPCVITGDAEGDRFGASVAYGDHLDGVTGPFVIVGSPGATSGGVDDAGAVYLFNTSNDPSCPRLPAAAQPTAIRLESADVSVFGTQVAFADPAPAGGAKLVIGATATNAALVFVTGSVASTVLGPANSRVVSFFAPGQPSLLLAAGAPAGIATVAVVPNGGFLNVMSNGVDDLDNAGSLPATQSGSSSSFGTFVMGPGPIESLALLRGPGEQTLVAWGVPNDRSIAQGSIVISAFPHAGEEVHIVDCEHVDTCFIGVDEQEEFGSSLAVASLRSPDGDLLIGAPGARRRDNGERVGAIYAIANTVLGTGLLQDAPPLVFGRDNDDPSTVLLYRLYGISEGQRFGHRVGVDGSTIVVQAGMGQSLLQVPDLVQIWGPQ